MVLPLSPFASKHISGLTRQQLSFFRPELIEVQRESFSRFLERGVAEELSRINPILHSPTGVGVFLLPDSYLLIAPSCSVRRAIEQGKTYGCQLYLPATLLLRKGFAFPPNPLSQGGEGTPPQLLTPSLPLREGEGGGEILSGGRGDGRPAVKGELGGAPLNVGKGDPPFLGRGENGGEPPLPPGKGGWGRGNTFDRPQGAPSFPPKLASPVGGDVRQAELGESMLVTGKAHWVALGTLPLMTGRGHFVINGVPRVLLSQLARAPGIYFGERDERDERDERGERDERKGSPKRGGPRLIYADVICRRGVWLRVQTRKRRRRFSLWAQLKKTRRIPLHRLANGLAAFDGELDLWPGAASRALQLLSGVLLYPLPKPGEHPRVGPERDATDFIWRKFRHPRSYDLGELGRQRINSKLKLSLKSLQLTRQDIVSLGFYTKNLQRNRGLVDDIDHLQNRRIRPSGELLQAQLETAVYRLERVVASNLQKRLSTPLLRLSHQKGVISLTPSDLFSPRPLEGALRELFGSSPLSQYMDQTNPLSEITHKRRFSSLGPGGVSRDTAGMQVRGIHPTHYGRICPIETPEGKNAGLVSSPTFFARVNGQGLLEAPCYPVVHGQVQRGGVAFFSAEREAEGGASIAAGDLRLSSSALLGEGGLPVRVVEGTQEGFQQHERESVGYVGVTPTHLLSVATALIPFLEHNDANRALMGSNMQRQAVPLVHPERPLVGTGLEGCVVGESGHTLTAGGSGYVSYVSGERITLSASLADQSAPPLPPLGGGGGSRQPGGSGKGPIPALSQSSKLPSPPLKRPLPGRGWGRLGGSRLSPPLWESLTGNPPPLPGSGHGGPTPLWGAEKGSGAGRGGTGIPPLSVRGGVSHPLSLLESLLPSKGEGGRGGRRKLPLSTVTYPLEQYKGSNQRTCLLQRPAVREGEWVQRGDLLADCASSDRGELAIGKSITVAYMPWEGYNFEDAVVISERLLHEDIYTSLHIRRYDASVRETEYGLEKIRATPHPLGSEEWGERLGLDSNGLVRSGKWVKPSDVLIGKQTPLGPRHLTPHERLAYDLLGITPPTHRDTSLRLGEEERGGGRVVGSEVLEWHTPPVPMGQQQTPPSPPFGGLGKGGGRRGGKGGGRKGMVKSHPIPRRARVYVATRKRIRIGDKVSGRHGNKGIISRILPREDMPYLPNGMPVDMVLNPLGVPSRMNVGQVMECLLGLAASHLGQRFKVTPFDEMHGPQASRALVYLKLYQARLRSGYRWLFNPDLPGKIRLVDGRSGLPFTQSITVGQPYMLKLIHMVDEKMHSRATGPYALVTMQPLGGKSHGGGQRVGEMEVWALEGFGAAYNLQEMLTSKSDDVIGRMQVIDSIASHQTPSFGNPEAFRVMARELRALCINVGVYNVDRTSLFRGKGSLSQLT